MSVPYIILSALILIISIALIAVILMQSKNIQGFGGGSLGGLGGTETYWDRNKGRSFEGQLEKFTKILSALFLILAFVMLFIK